MNQTIRKRIEDINNGIVPEGYKQTPFGIFPCAWETDKTYGELFEFNGSLSQSREELGEEGYAYLHYGDMHRNSFNTVSYEQYSRLPKVNIPLKGKEKYLMKDGDIAFLDASEDLDGTSRCVLIDNPDNAPFFAGLHTIPAREKKDNFSKWYKQYITLPDYVRKQFQRLACGFKVYGLNKETIAKLYTAFPKDKDEQSKIAEILMKWDEMVELQEQYIQKLELRKKAIIQQLLMNNGGWVETPLTKVIKERKTYAVLDSEYPHVTLGKSGVVDKTEQYERDFLVKSDDKEYKITYPNDIAYNPANLKFGVICVNKYPTPAIFSPIYVTFEVNDKYNVDFVGAVLCGENFVRYIRKYEEGSLYERQAVKPEDFLKGKILMPERKVQDNIAKIIQLADEEISSQKEKLEKIKIQRKAMQQYLLTGIVRVL